MALSIDIILEYKIIFGFSCTQSYSEISRLENWVEVKTRLADFSNWNFRVWNLLNLQGLFILFSRYIWRVNCISVESNRRFWLYRVKILVVRLHYLILERARLDSWTLSATRPRHICQLISVFLSSLLYIELIIFWCFTVILWVIIFGRARSMVRSSCMSNFCFW